MKDIVETSSGFMWREVESTEEALRIGTVTETAFGRYVELERKFGVKNRYFALGDDFSVIGCVPLPGKARGHIRPANGLPLFVAHKNGDPFPTHEREISELAHAIGAEITSAHYPYHETDGGLSEQGQDENASLGP